MEKEGECRGGNSRFVVASDHGVPHEGVGFGYTAEETMGVADVAGVGEGAEREDSAEGEGVVDEADDGHACLNLPQLVHGGTCFHDH